VHAPATVRADALKVIRGGAGVVGGVVQGSLGVVSSIGKNATRGLATLSFDSEYLKSREIAAVHDQGLGRSVGHGAVSFGKGIFDGVTGVVAQPVKGAMQDGAKGFGMGLGRGLAGLVVKPVAGTLDLVTGSIQEVSELAGRTIVRTNPEVRVHVPRQLSQGVLGLSQRMYHLQARPNVVWPVREVRVYRAHSTQGSATARVALPPPRGFLPVLSGLDGRPATLPASSGKYALGISFRTGPNVEGDQQMIQELRWSLAVTRAEIEAEKREARERGDDANLEYLVEDSDGHPTRFSTKFDKNHPWCL